MNLWQRFEVWGVRRRERLASEAAERQRLKSKRRYERKMPVCREVGHDKLFLHNTSAGSTYRCRRCGIWILGRGSFRPDHTTKQYQDEFPPSE